MSFFGDEPLTQFISIAFLCVIIVVLGGSVVRLFRIRTSKTLPLDGSRFTRQAPSLLTSIGVAGTFLGIFIGLFNFDVDNIDRSVPELLDGLRFAFLTSVAGLISAIIFKAFDVFVPVQELPVSETQTDPNDPVSLLRQLAAESQKQTKALIGDEDQSLLSQMKLLRTDASDAHREQMRAFEDFAERISELSSRALVEALQEVIRDFNDNLTEQFGENFRELNKAVEKLVHWQENYRQHVEQSEALLRNAAERIADIERSLDAVSTSMEPVPQAAMALKEAVELANQQISSLASLVGTFGELQQRAEDAFPTIERNLEQLTAGFQESVETTNATIRNSTDLLQETLRSNFERLMTSYGEQVDETTRKISESGETLREAMDQRFEEFDRQSQQEVNRVLEVMGRNLASISERLADDYERVAIAVGQRAS